MAKSFGRAIAKAPPVVALSVDGKSYGGWKTVRISRSIEALCGSFALGVSERWAGQDQPWPIGENSPCVVSIGGAAVITGFVDERDPSYDATSHSVTIEGRDAAGDLVDCSTQLGKWSFSNVDVLALAQKIAAPFNVSVSLQTGLISTAVTVPKKYSIDPGDLAAGSLENLCRVAGLLAISDGLGGILLTRAGTARCSTALVEGQNILKASAKFSAKGRFRTYEVMGSHKGREDLNGASAAGVKGTATDLNARAGRVLIIRPDHSLTPATAKLRAGWEASVRAARADAVSVTVAGWTQADGTVWPINKIVGVHSKRIGVHGDMLIAGVELNHDESTGTTATLSLKDPAAYSPDPTINKQGAGAPNYWKEITDAKDMRTGKTAAAAAAWKGI